VYLEGFEGTTAPLPTAKEAAQHILKSLYADRPREWQTWEKRTRNAEIYRRYLAGEDSVVLAKVFGLSDRRIRTIVEHERKRGNM
jgi:Mor family transcriptional regulator